MKLIHLFQHLGLDIKDAEKVHGGDINEAFCLQGSETKYFLKINNAVQYPGRFLKEANGLDTLRKCPSLLLPKVIKHGTLEDVQYLLLEWMDEGTPAADAQHDLGSNIARMHQTSQEYFGFTEDNYIGSIPQKNTPTETWSDFYTQCRILPLVKILADTNVFSKADVAQATSFCTSVGKIFPIETPSILHGDLWGGNYLIASSGYASLIDPAVYFGHREMDIGMTRLFGGFSNDFYTGYNEVFPLEKGWEKRLPFTQLYPLLVHAVLFGGHYVNNVRTILKQF